MQASKLRSSITHGLILVFAVVIASQISAFTGNLVLGVLLRKILLPIAVLAMSLFVVQIWRPGWTISFVGFPREKSTIIFILLSSLLTGFLIIRFAEALNYINILALILTIVFYFASLYFILVEKAQYALALLLISMPLMDFFQWDSGHQWGLLEPQIGKVTLEVHGAHIYIASLFGAWIATKVIQGRFQLTKLRLYIPVVLLILLSVASYSLVTFGHNKEWALRTLLTVLVFPLLLYILMVETINTIDKVYLIIYSSIGMVFIYIFLSFYMSFRSGVITPDMTRMAVKYGLIDYVTGSVAVKGMMLGLIAPLLLGLLGTAKDIRQTLLNAGLFVYVAIGLIISFSRTGMLAALTGATFVLKSRKVRLLILLAIVIISVFWQPIYDNLMVRFHDIKSFEDISLKEISYSRYASWIAAISMLREQPILGVGLKNFGDHAIRFSDAYYYRKSESGGIDVVYMHDTHNIFLTVVAELGLVGLGILLWFLVVLLIELMKGLSVIKKQKLAPLGWGLLGVYVSHLVLGLFDYGFWVIKSSLGINVLCWTLFALMTQLRIVGNQTNSKNNLEAE